MLSFLHAIFSQLSVPGGDQLVSPMRKLWDGPNPKGYMSMYLKGGVFRFDQNANFPLAQCTGEMYLAWMSDADIDTLWKRLDLLPDERLIPFIRRDLLRKVLETGVLPNLTRELVDRVWGELEFPEIPALHLICHLKRSKKLYALATGTEETFGTIVDGQSRLERPCLIASVRLGRMCNVDNRYIAGLGMLFGCPIGAPSHMYLAFAVEDWKLDDLLNFAESNSSLSIEHILAALCQRYGIGGIISQLSLWKKYLYIFTHLHLYSSRRSDQGLPHTSSPDLAYLYTFDGVTDQVVSRTFPGAEMVPRVWVRQLIAESQRDTLFLFPVDGEWRICLGRFTSGQFQAFPSTLFLELIVESPTMFSLDLLGHLAKNIERYEVLYRFLNREPDAQIRLLAEIISNLVE